MEECFIAVLPPEPLLTKLMKNISRLLSSKKALTFPPHITLVPRFRTEKYSELLSALSKYCKRKDSFELNLVRCSHFLEPPIIYIEANFPANIHEELLKLASNFRTPWIRENFLNGTFSEKQQKYIKKYGSPYVKEFYNSHITIAGPDIDPKKFQSLLKRGLPAFSGIYVIDKIAVLRKVDGKWIVDKFINF
ncbi:2'-5' RNA ligase family protein [Candidatus Woesearchaeota archaeon]|nr:2'-5' RNA ligase family protein [Candidatus Woesearchaeota archaeon]